MLARFGMKVRPDKREGLLEVLRAIVGPTKAMPGCLSCGLFQDMQDDNRFALHVEWQDQQALWRFIRTDDFTALLVATDLLEEKPDIRFDTIAHSSGIEAIVAARNTSDTPGEGAGG